MMSRKERLLRRLAPTPTLWTTIPSLPVMSKGLPAELWMPSERRITAATSLGGSCFDGGRQRPQQRGGFARWRQSRQFLRTVQQLRLFGKCDRQQAKIVLQLFTPFLQLAAGLVEAGYARRVVGNAHRRRAVQQKDHRGLFRNLVLIAEYRSEQQHHDQQNGRHAQGQQHLPLPGPQRAESPIIKPAVNRIATAATASIVVRL